jgi:hypothetical protein
VTQPARTCPGCGRPFRPAPDHPWRPFCSERCQLIDLGAWLGERHAIAGEPIAPAPEAPEESS